VKLDNGFNRNIWAVGQCQGDDYVGIAPVDKEGARKPIVPKPAWK